MNDVLLQSDRVLLRPWRVEDARWYVEARDEEVFRWTTEDRALTVNATVEAIQRVNSDACAYCFAIVNPLADEKVGNIALETVDEQAGLGELHYWLSPVGRGKGIATASVRLLLDWAFETRGLMCVVIKTMSGNAQSRRVAERAGFRPVQAPVTASINTAWEWFERRRGEA